MDCTFDLLDDPPATVAAPRATSVGLPGILFACTPSCPTSFPVEHLLHLSPEGLDGAAAPTTASIHPVIEKIAARGLAPELEVEHGSPRGISLWDGSLRWHVSRGATSFANQQELLA